VSNYGAIFETQEYQIQVAMERNERSDNKFFIVTSFARLYRGKRANILM
jgi:hypothetical protein